MKSLKAQTSSTQNQKSKSNDDIQEIEGIEMDDKDDWANSDWTEITQEDLNTSSASTHYSVSDISQKVSPILDKKLERLQLELEQLISCYIDDDSITHNQSKLDQFTQIWNDSKELDSKIDQEKADNDRLMGKLEDIQNTEINMLNNRIGHIISLEWDYVDCKSEVLKAKTVTLMDKSKLIQNTAETLLYGPDQQKVLSKVKEILERKTSENKTEKQRLLAQTEEYEENSVHLKPLVHQYYETMKSIREIDLQVRSLWET